MFRIGVALIFSGIAWAQTAQQSEVADAAKSPMTLARYVEAHSTNLDWAALWNAIGGRDPTFPTPPCQPPMDRPCSAQILTVLNPDQAILIIQGAAPQTNDLYLRYLQSANGEWRFAGERRAFVKQFPRRHEVFKIDGTPFLKISSDHSQIGAGFVQEIEDWFDLTQPDFEPVFSFTVDGTEQRFDMGVGRSIHAQAIPIEASGRIVLALSVHFVGVGLDTAARYTGTYERLPDAKEFTLRSAYADPDPRSVIPTQDFQDLATVFHITDEKLLAYALPGLQKIATGSDPDAKKWLRSVLDNAKDTPEKHELLQLLGK